MHVVLILTGTMATVGRSSAHTELVVNDLVDRSMNNNNNNDDNVPRDTVARRRSTDD